MQESDEKTIKNCMHCNAELRYDCTIMGQPATGTGNHSKVGLIIGQKYSSDRPYVLRFFACSRDILHFGSLDTDTVRHDS